MRLILVDPHIHAVAFIDSGRSLGHAVSPQLLSTIVSLHESYPPALFWASEKMEHVDFSLMHVTPRNLSQKEDFYQCNLLLSPRP